MATDITEYFASDSAFDALYPIYVRNLSEIHWTPLEVIKVAARFLAPCDSAHVLDIGAGVGKFCAAGSYFTSGHFTGIEQRLNFVRVGNKTINTLKLDRATIIHGNFVDIDLSQFTGIYFFNSFHENIVLSDSLDQKIERTPELYDRYTAHLLSQLLAMPAGTLLATYWLSITEVPACYKLCGSRFNHLLKLWRKEY
jgi:hypothetical protein